MENLNGIDGLDALFDDEKLDKQMTFLDEKKQGKNDGLYRVDMSKVSDKSRGWRATLRLLPNVKADNTLGESAVSKVTHYANIKPVEGMPQLDGLSGFYDSPKNFGEPCLLSQTFYKLDQSNEQLKKDRAKLLNYSKNFYSYALVVEDEQQPELVGKIVIFKYGVTIKDKIDSERKGETGDPCNVFNLERGKDLILIIRENDVPSTNDPSKTIRMPDYKKCNFRQNSTPISLPVNGEMKQVPLAADGKIKPELKARIIEFLKNREHDLSEFEAKKQTPEEEAKIAKIVEYLTTGEVRSTATATGGSSAAQPSKEDFSFDETPAPVAAPTAVAANDDDFNFDNF